MTIIQSGGNLNLQLIQLQQQGSPPMEKPFPQQAGYEHTPIALIFSDNDTAIQIASEAVIAAGGRIGGCASISEASNRLANQAVIDAVFVDIADDPGEQIDGLLKGINAWSNSSGIPTIISAPIEIIDLVAAHLQDDNVTLLCTPDPVDRVSAIMDAWTRKDATLHDVSTEIDGIRIKQISDEVSRLSRSLSRLVAGALTPIDAQASSSEDGRVNAVRLDFHAEPMASANNPPVDAAEVRAILRLRRMRSAYFSAELFADPAWDMLLDLTAAQLEGEKVAVSSLCIASAVPATTALRWIKTMCDAKLLERHSDPLDGRRIFIGLSAGAANAMLTYLGAAKKVAGLPV
jgi:hypothetical protein